MEYIYYNRGKCTACNQIVWTTGSDHYVICNCHLSTLCADSNTLEEISDLEHIEAIQLELGITTEITLINGSTSI